MRFHPGKRPWLLVKQADIALPCATQNEVSEGEARGLIDAGVRLVAEGSNMVRLHNPLGNPWTDSDPPIPGLYPRGD